MTIVNSNGYTGKTTIGPYATLQIGAGGAIGSLSPSPSAAIVDNGALVFSRSDNIVQGTHFSSAGITGGGSLTQLGAGMLTLTASNTYLGLTTISAGTLQLGTGAAGQDGSINGTSGVTNNGTLAYNLAGSQTASYSIGGSGGLEKSGTGTLVLSTFNTYMGGTTVNAGTLQLNQAASGGVGTLEPRAPVTVNPGATLRVNAEDAFGYYTGSAGSISLIGGTITISSGIHTNVGYLGMTAGTVTSLGQGDGNPAYNFILNAGVTTYASSAPSVINANALELRDSVNSRLQAATSRVQRGPWQRSSRSYRFVEPPPHWRLGPRHGWARHHVVHGQRILHRQHGDRQRHAASRRRRRGRRSFPPAARSSMKARWPSAAATISCRARSSAAARSPASAA